MTPERVIEIYNLAPRNIVDCECESDLLCPACATAIAAESEREKAAAVKELVEALEEAVSRLDRISGYINGMPTPEDIHEAYLDAYSGGIRALLSKHSPKGEGAGK